MKEKSISRNVLFVGFTSFFTDISSEMIYPLIQAFVRVLAHGIAGPVLGLIEGVSEAIASLLKVYSGALSDKLNKRKIPAIAGYSLSVLSKILLIPAGYFFMWILVFLSRLFDRVGKGIRTAPRDALIAESTAKAKHGTAFGFHRAMDFAGATIGALIAFLLVQIPFNGQSLDSFMEAMKQTQFVDQSVIDPLIFIFLIASVPAVIGVVFLFFTRDIRVAAPQEKKERTKFSFSDYDKNLKIFFIATIIFTIGNSSNQFLLMRSMDLGFALSAVILMYIMFNLSSTLLSTFFGSLSDKIGRKKLIVAGYSLYAIVYTCFGILHFFGQDTSWLLWVLWPIYGIYYAMTEGVEKALVSDLAPADKKATSLGLYHTVAGISLLPASLIAGALYLLFSPLPFIFGGFMAAGSVVLIILSVKSPGDDNKILKIKRHPEIDPNATGIIAKETTKKRGKTAAAPKTRTKKKPKTATGTPQKKNVKKTAKKPVIKESKKTAEKKKSVPQKKGSTKKNIPGKKITAKNPVNKQPKKAAKKTAPIKKPIKKTTTSTRKPVKKTVVQKAPNNKTETKPKKTVIKKK